MSVREETIQYDDAPVRWFIWASILFGLVGMLVGALAATQLATHQANLGLPYTTFSRIRPLHTNAVIFAFVGNMMFAGIYYSTQRLLKTRMASDLLTRIHFWGWQLIIVAAAVTLPLGISTSKEYAELEWPIDLAITLVWVVFAVNFFWTLGRRNEKNLYVSIWFYIGTIVTVAVLHVVNSFALPLDATKSYSAYAGVQDALVQWWYGHNAVAFFLTTPILGIMYYFLPKAAERPVYSYRLSIVHFWGLVFMYIWAGPHHLLHTALPAWAQTLGMLFSLMIWAPSWGGMLNGLLTLRGAWDRVRADPVLKFFAAGVTFYGMATLEGPLMSIKSVNALSHYTDWTIGHAHGGALGWNGFLAAGMFYWLIPRLYGKPLRSVRAADAHFWVATVGIVLYMVAMWISGITQGLMWKAKAPDGTLLYPSFVETLMAIRPQYWVRLVGGLMYLGGFGLMIWNLAATARAGRPVVAERRVVVEVGPPQPSWRTILTGKPFIVAAVAVLISLPLGWNAPALTALVIAGVAGFGMAWWIGRKRWPEYDAPPWHALVEGRALIFTSLTLVAVLVGGVAELLPTLLVDSAVPVVGAASKPYSALELEGRDLYIREGCQTCHSQMVRPVGGDVERYGKPSRAEEFVHDHPFQWGSKRTGPDLHRLGGKYPALWHYTHLMDPRATSPGSNMPAYTWFAERRLDLDKTPRKLALLSRLGVPYTKADVEAAPAALRLQAEGIAGDLAKQGVKLPWDSEMVAMIAYLDRLGRPESTAPQPAGLVAEAR